MLLALDVGNTNITAGVFHGKILVSQFRIATSIVGRPQGLSASLQRWAGRYREEIRRAIYASVVPRINATLEVAVERSFGCRAISVTPASKLGMRLAVRIPRQVGADRILNALAAYEYIGGAAVVIDFGTATTFDCVSSRGDYLGGAIVPGPSMAANALHEHTAKLPLVALRRPRRAIGKDTVECIQAGLYFGYVGMIEKVLKVTMTEMRRQGQGKAPRVLATGGLCGLFRRELREQRVVLAPDLTLQGLRIAYERIAQGGLS